MADDEAKKAAAGNCSHPDEIPKELLLHLLDSAAATKQAFLERLSNEATTIWQTSPRYSKMVRIDRQMANPKNHFLKLTSSFSKAQTSLLMQLRTGHISLNAHLYRIGKADSPICPGCNIENESVRHFVLECPAYTREREYLEIADARLSRSLPMLLNHDRMILHLFRYIAATERLSAVFGNVRPSDD